MLKKYDRAAARARRHRRVRGRVTGTPARPRLVVTRSRANITAQIIDDFAGHTIVSASTIQADVKSGLKSCGDAIAAAHVGTVVATRAMAAGVEAVVFDRGGYPYHGRVQALAEAARKHLRF